MPIFQEGAAHEAESPLVGGTMKALGILDDALSPSRMLVHAYDDSTRK